MCRQPQVVQLGQVSLREDAAVTSLAFSLQGSILVAGHASGDVNFWEFRRVAWECVKSVQDVHVSPIVQARFFLFSDLYVLSNLEVPLATCPSLLFETL